MVVGAKSHRGDPQDVNFYALCFFVSSGLESLEGFRCHVECLKKKPSSSLPRWIFCSVPGIFSYILPKLCCRKQLKSCRKSPWNTRTQYPLVWGNTS